MTQTRRNSHLIDLDKTPTHHTLQPGDWWQFIRDEPMCGEDGALTQVGDVITYQFKDEPFKRQFRVLAMPLENVYSCSYLSRC